MRSASHGRVRITSATLMSPCATRRLSSARANRAWFARSRARMRCGPAETIVAVAFIDQLTFLVAAAVGRRGAAARVELDTSAQFTPAVRLRLAHDMLDGPRMPAAPLRHPRVGPNPLSEERFVKLRQKMSAGNWRGRVRALEASFFDSPGMIVGENPGPVAHPAGDSRDVAGAQPTRPTVGSWSGARRSVYLLLLDRKSTRSLARA